MNEPNPSPDPVSCPNCQARLHGPYCHECGQRDLDLTRASLWSLSREWLDQAFSLDSRLVHTLRLLCTRPGALTVELLAGRRVRQVPPLRLFLVLSVVMFLALALSGHSFIQSSDENVIVAAADGSVASGFGASGRVADSEPEPAIAEPAEGEEPDPLLPDPGDDFDAAELNQRILAYLPQASVLLAPVLALFSWGVYRRQYRRFVPHLLFSLHVHSFAFLAVTLATLGDLALGFDQGWLGVVAVLAVPMHLYLAQRRVYAAGRLRAAAMTLMLGLGQLMALVFLILGLLILVLAGS